MVKYGKNLFKIQLISVSHIFDTLNPDIEFISLKNEALVSPQLLRLGQNTKNSSKQ